MEREEGRLQEEGQPDRQTLPRNALRRPWSGTANLERWIFLDLMRCSCRRLSSMCWCDWLVQAGAPWDEFLRTCWLTGSLLGFFNRHRPGTGWLNGRRFRSSSRWWSQPGLLHLTLQFLSLLRFLYFFSFFYINFSSFLAFDECSCINIWWSYYDHGCMYNEVRWGEYHMMGFAWHDMHGMQEACAWACVVWLCHDERRIMRVSNEFVMRHHGYSIIIIDM